MKSTSLETVKKNSSNFPVTGYAAAFVLCAVLLPANGYANDGKIDFRNCSESEHSVHAYTYNSEDVSFEISVEDKNISPGSSHTLKCNTGVNCAAKLKTASSTVEIKNYSHKNMYILVDSDKKITEHGHNSSTCDK